MEQDLTIIQNFHVLPEQSLELLGKRLGLRMSRAELLFCARHYKSRGKGEISVDALRFIDALACPAYVTLDKIAIGELLTDHACVADTFADAVSKLKALGKHPDKPFTLQDIADLSVRYTAAVNQKDITEPIGIDGTAAQYAAKGFDVQFPIESDVARFDVLQPLPTSLQAQAAYADALVLLCPAPDAQSAEFDHAVTALLRGELGGKIHCVCDTARESIAHAVLRIGSGAVINLARLPEPLDSALALTECRDGLMLALPQDLAPALVQAAQEIGLGAYEMGIVDHAGYLIVRRDKDTLLTLDVPYLKSICFIRSYTLRLNDKTAHTLPATLPLHVPEDALDESCNPGGTVLRTLPPLRTRNAVYDKQPSFRTAALCALQAYCTAVAAGSDPKRIWLHAHVAQSNQGTMTKAASELLCTLLGLYRLSMELGVPVHTDTAFVQDDSGIAVLASAPSDMVIPAHFRGNGRIYLLAVQSDANGMPVYSELRALISYLRRAMTEGKIKSARAVLGSTPADALAKADGKACDVILNPYGTQMLDTPCTCAFLVEYDSELAGELIALTGQPNFAQNDNNS